jgi:hypothetical protein
MGEEQQGPRDEAEEREEDLELQDEDAADVKGGMANKFGPSPGLYDK